MTPFTSVLTLCLLMGIIGPSSAQLSSKLPSYRPPAFSGFSTLVRMIQNPSSGNPGRRVYPGLRVVKSNQRIRNNPNPPNYTKQKWNPPPCHPRAPCNLAGNSNKGALDAYSRPSLPSSENLKPISSQQVYSAPKIPPKSYSTPVNLNYDPYSTSSKQSGTEVTGWTPLNPPYYYKPKNTDNARSDVAESSAGQDEVLQTVERLYLKNSAGRKHDKNQ